MINEVLTTGNIFVSDESQEVFDENIKGFQEVKDTIDK